MKTTVNERVKSLREHLGLNQNEFANGIETTITSISRIENGFTAPRSSTLHKIIKAYGIDKDWLVNGIGELKVIAPSSKVEETQILWKDEAYSALKEEIIYLREMLKMAITSKTGNPNFLKASDVAGVSLSMLRKVNYSVANAQC